MSAFPRLLAITLIAGTTNNFVWFALTYWAYLSTGSVVSTSTMAGIFLVVSILSNLWFGSLVDRHKKRHALLGSSFASLTLFAVGLGILWTRPAAEFATVASPWLWIFVLILLSGTIAGSIYHITVPTLIGLTVRESERAKANGMFGMITGIGFGITSVASGYALQHGGMDFVLLLALACTVVVILALALLKLPEPEIAATDAAPAERSSIDIKGTIAAVRAIPGLFPLIFFTTFNNFLGGVFFSLMDAYGLTLVSVEVWGLLWGILSLSFILGGLYVAKKGLGADPLRTLFRINLLNWAVCMVFTLQPSIVLLMAGTFVWMFFMPHIEATEQTIFQKVVPPDRLGRVFGFAHSVEQSASPITAFLIGPITQLMFIPFMTDGAGVDLIGSWFGTGPGRGIALVFIFAGAIGFLVTAIARRSSAFTTLSERYRA